MYILSVNIHSIVKYLISRNVLEINYHIFQVKTKIQNNFGQKLIFLNYNVVKYINRCCRKWWRIIPLLFNIIKIKLYFWYYSNPDNYLILENSGKLDLCNTSYHNLCNKKVGLTKFVASGNFPYLSGGKFPPILSYLFISFSFNLNFRSKMYAAVGYIVLFEWESIYTTIWKWRSIASPNDQ